MSERGAENREELAEFAEGKENLNVLILKIK